MRKVIAALIIVLVTMIYFVSVRKDVEQQNITQNIKIQVEDALQHYKENYPTTIEAVLDGHAEIMRLQYSKGITDSDIPIAVAALRLFYSEETLALNDELVQVSKLTSEVARNAENDVYLLQSSLMGVTYKEDQVVAKMKHATTHGDIYRQYYLVEENNGWKIKEWRTAE